MVQQIPFNQEDLFEDTCYMYEEDTNQLRLSKHQIFSLSNQQLMNGDYSYSATRIATKNSIKWDTYGSEICS